MEKPSYVSLLLGLWVLVCSHASYGQQAEAPMYKDGEWWRIRQELTRGGGAEASGVCSEVYPEYLVRIQAGKRNVIGIKDNQQEGIDCPRILALVLGQSDLKFPLYVGLSWSDRRSRQIPGTRSVLTDYQYEVKSWEKIKTDKGEFDAFKIVRSHRVSAPRVAPYWQAETYYYAPSVKAIIRYSVEEELVKATTTLVDFSVTQ